jgi:hypothetical protein
MRDMTGDQTRFSKYIFNAYFVLAGGIGEEASKEARHVQKSKNTCRCRDLSETRPLEMST